MDIFDETLKNLRDIHQNEISSYIKQISDINIKLKLSKDELALAQKDNAKLSQKLQRARVKLLGKQQEAKILREALLKKDISGLVVGVNDTDIHVPEQDSKSVSSSIPESSAILMEVTSSSTLSDCETDTLSGSPTDIKTLSLTSSSRSPIGDGEKLFPERIVTTCATNSCSDIVTTIVPHIEPIICSKDMFKIRYSLSKSRKRKNTSGSIKSIVQFLPKMGNEDSNINSKERASDSEDSTGIDYRSNENDNDTVEELSQQHVHDLDLSEEVALKYTEHAHPKSNTPCENMFSYTVLDRDVPDDFSVTRAHNCTNDRGYIEMEEVSMKGESDDECSSPSLLKTTVVCEPLVSVVPKVSSSSSYSRKSGQLGQNGTCTKKHNSVQTTLTQLLKESDNDTDVNLISCMGQPTQSPVKADDNDTCMIPPTPWVKPKQSSWQKRLIENDSSELTMDILEETHAIYNEQFLQDKKILADTPLDVTSPTNKIELLDETRAVQDNSTPVPQNVDVESTHSCTRPKTALTYAQKLAKRAGLPTYEHVAVIRKKDDRAKLDGKACHECAKWYNYDRIYKNQADHLRKICKHKKLFHPHDSDPSIWNISFPRP